MLRNGVSLTDAMDEIFQKEHIILDCTAASVLTRLMLWMHQMHVAGKSFETTIEGARDRNGEVALRPFLGSKTIAVPLIRELSLEGAEKLITNAARESKFQGRFRFQLHNALCL